MKVVIIGGAGIRVPLLTNGLLRFHSDLPVEELVLWDIDEARRRTIARISRAMVARFDLGLKVSTPADWKRRWRTPRMSFPASEWVESAVGSWMKR